MESLVNYIPSILQMITDSINIQPLELDIITSYEFAEIRINNTVKECLLIGYERGFQIWDISNSSSPVQWMSKRDFGISSIHSISSESDGLIALTSLYDTSVFPQDCIKIYSLMQKRISLTIQASDKVLSIISNSIALCACLDNCSIDIFSINSFEKLYSIIPERCFPYSMRLVAGISNLYIAYSLKDQELPQGSLTTKVSKTVQNLAQDGYSKLISYIDSPSKETNNLDGKVTIKNILNSQIIAEFQAFTKQVSELRFSKSSHILVVSPIDGNSFHVYRINPPKSITETGKYQLIYKLTRGRTFAEICDITISKCEKWISVSTSRGTTHIYQINPQVKNLCYDHNVFTRVKYGSYLEPGLNPKIKFLHTIKLDDPAAPSKLELLSFTENGTLSKYSVEEPAKCLSSTVLIRNVNFRDEEFRIKIEEEKLDRTENFIEINTWNDENFLPLRNIKKMNFIKSRNRYEETLAKRNPELESFDGRSESEMNERDT